MCSSPPKPPKFEKVDTFQAYKQHSRYDEFMKESGTTGFNSDNDVKNFNRWLLKDTFETESKDETFVKAFNELINKGNLTGVQNIDYTSKEAKQFRKQYQQTGKKGNWRTSFARQNFDFSDDQDLQRVYDRQFEIRQSAVQDEINARLDEQNQGFLDQQEKQARQNKRLMKEMMDQPQFTARQAALPKIQYKAKAPDPVPAQPAPPPVMNISPAPAPELVNIGNQMGIVKQSSTARSRSRQRTRGTASLT